MESLKNKIVVITGAGSGIGRHLALQLADQGAKLALNDYNAETLKETEALIGEQTEVFSQSFDVAEKTALRGFAAATLDHYNEVDVVINNAGVALGRVDIVDTPDEDWDWVVNINLWGVVNGTRAFLPSLLSRPEASLVNVSSAFGIAGIAKQAPYCMTKFAVRGFTESLRMECIDTNLCISCVHPGGVGTNIIRNGRVGSEQRDKLIKTFDEKMARTSADQAARTIINGIKKKKTRILVGEDAKWVDRVVRLFPNNYEKILDKGAKAAKVRKTE